MSNTHYGEITTAVELDGSVKPTGNKLDIKVFVSSYSGKDEIYLCLLKSDNTVSQTVLSKSEANEIGKALLEASSDV